MKNSLKEIIKGIIISLVCFIVAAYFSTLIFAFNWRMVLQDTKNDSYNDGKLLAYGKLLLGIVASISINIFCIIATVIYINNTQTR